MLQIRKTLLMRDIASSELGRIVDHPTNRAVALAAIGKPHDEENLERPNACGSRHASMDCA
jgi:hypothetical protein